MPDTRSRILGEQQGWAARRGIAVDGSGYTQDLDANLFQPLHPETMADFRRGGGDELGRKMRALHSSSALVVNTFDDWRSRPMDWLAGAMPLGSEPSSLRFEAQFHTGLQGNPPNLDVAFLLVDGRTVAVESKFTETYAHTSHAVPFKDKYFPTGEGLWHARGLPRCQELAARLRNQEIQFRYLNAAQLLKHSLGLAKCLGGRFALVYLWYAFPSEEAKKHEEEINAFAEGVGTELDFRALTYQQLFSPALSGIGPGHDSYVSYLTERCLPGHDGNSRGAGYTDAWA
jgi:hypothetical protein